MKRWVWIVAGFNCLGAGVLSISSGRPTKLTEHALLAVAALYCYEQSGRGTPKAEEER